MIVHSYSFETALIRSYHKEEKRLLLKIRLLYSSISFCQFIFSSTCLSTVGLFLCTMSYMYCDISTAFDSGYFVNKLKF